MPTSTIKKENEAATSFSSQTPKGAFKMINQTIYNPPEYFQQKNILNEINKLKKDISFRNREADRCQSYFPNYAKECRKIASTASLKLQTLIRNYAWSKNYGRNHSTY